MKKFKYLLSAILVAALVITSVFAEETKSDAEYDLPEKVEISFSVGDDVLIINGEEVTTETAPYVVETATGGVTLVPVRVITEAFGAKVGWEESTQTVTLDYPDVKIVLQIGNPVAEVNGEAVTLLTAPELPGGRTMVPLRFISENFGAEVGYDDATQAITVTKENAVEEGGTIVGSADELYVGDSFYGWSMENPKDMKLSTRSFDGKRTVFNSEQGGLISIYIKEKKEDFDFDKEFKELRNYWSEEFTLTKAETDVSNENEKKMHIQVRNGDAHGVIKYIVTDKYIFDIYCSYTVSDEVNNKIVYDIAETFSLVYDFNNTHDLSNLEDGFRKYESEELNFTLKLPADFNDSSDSNSKINEFRFATEGNNNCRVELQIYSKSQLERSPLEQMKKDMSDTTKCINEKYRTVVGVNEFTYGDIKAYGFEMKIEGSMNADSAWKVMMFESGDYAYRMVIILDRKKYENAEEVIEQIISNATFGAIDSEKVGLLLPPIDEELYEMEEKTFGNYLVDVPAGYDEASQGTTSAYTDGRLVVVMITTPSMNGYSAMDFAEALTNQTVANKNYTVEEHVNRVVLKNGSFYKSIIKSDVENSRVYTVMYICEKAGVYYVFQFTMPDVYYSNFHLDLAEDIIESMRESED